MAVNRQQRQFGIKPIGVMRTGSSGQPVANAIVNAANELRSRTFDIAVREAKDRGARTAAELDLPSITTLDDATRVPVAMRAASSMGRYSREAFENVLLKRFENAISDDITAKQAELMQTLADKPNAPKLFEETFKNYLDGMAGNASGYYKQVIVDYGASSMEDGRSRLRVAQIAKMQADAKAAKARQDNEFLQYSFNQGAAGEGDFASFFMNATKLGTDYEDYKSIGVSEDGEYPKLYQQAQQAWAKGRINTILQDPEIAKQSSLIFNYLSTGGNKALLEMLSPKARSAVRSIERVSTAESTLDLINLASETSDIFTQANKAGSAILAKEEADRNAMIEQLQAEDEQQRLAAEAQLQRTKDNATRSSVDLKYAFKEGYFSGVGEHGSSLQFYNAIEELDGYLSGQDPAVIGRDLYNTILSDVESSKDQMAQGVLRTALKGLNEAEIEALSFALQDGRMGEIAGFFPSKDSFNRFMVGYTKDEGSQYSKIASDWLAGKKNITDKVITGLRLNLSEDKRRVSAILKDDSLTMMQKSSAYEEFVKEHSKHKSVSKEFISARSDLDGLIDSATDKANKKAYGLQSQRIINVSNPANVQSSLTQLEKLGADTNQSPEDVVKDAQGIVNTAMSQLVSTQSVIFQDNEFGVSQLRLMSQYAKQLIAPNGLTEQAKGIVDYALDQVYQVNGAEIKASNTALSESLSSMATAKANTMRDTRAAKTELYFESSYLDGVPVNNASDRGVQSKLAGVIAKNAGYEDGRLPNNIFEKSDLDYNDAAALSIMRQNMTAFPIQFMESANRLLQLTMPAENIPTFVRNLREFGFFENAAGGVSPTPALMASMGAERSAQLETLLRAQTLAPTGNVAAYTTRVIEAIKNPIGKEDFTELTGFLTAKTFLTDQGVPSYLHNELEPVVTNFVTAFGKEGLDMMESALAARYAENANSYNAMTGGSYVPFDPSLSGVNMKKFEKGVSDFASKVAPELRFEIGSDVSIEDIKAEASILPFQITKDTFDNQTEERGKARISDRVLYGATMDSTSTNTKYQLYKVDQFGTVTAIPNSVFNMNTFEIANALGTLAPPTPVPEPTPEAIAPLPESPELSKDPKAPNLTKSPTYGIDINDPKFSGLTRIEREQLSQRIDFVNNLRALKYPPIPTAPIIMPDDKLINRVSSISGPKSASAQIMKNFNLLDSPLTMRTEITKVINMTEDLPKTKGRDEVLRQLYDIRNSLHGKRRLNE